MNTRKCICCKTEKLVIEFTKKKNGYYNSYCNICKKVKDRDRYNNNHIFRESQINSKLIQRYNITLEEYNKLFIIQDGRCAVCGKHQSELSRKLAVDHNHTTGEIRGLLCNNCNLTIGYLKEDILVINNIIIYLTIK